MEYTLQFSAVFEELPYLLGGAWVTLQIALWLYPAVMSTLSP